MHRTLRNLWQYKAGSLIASEYSFIGVILALGIVVGLTNIREAINVELAELGNAILAMNQDNTISGSNGAVTSADGAQAIDTPALLEETTLTPPFATSLFDQQPSDEYLDLTVISPFVPGRNEGAWLLRRRV